MLHIAVNIIGLLLVSGIARGWLPVKGLTFMTEHQFFDRIKSADVQVVDIRDPIDHEQEHHPDAINIYLGRLPYLYKKELDKGSEIMIISTSKSTIRKAARILNKAGYNSLFGVLWIGKNDSKSKEGQTKANISVVS
ncbi:rhodanese-like domain-containing protein [Paenibacillus provencensis]|uniref:Rhodanese-like domain-containing protein n=1 Tax=Paenibacillus provencensis TaxID=441151 RepID=A0ABW3PTJ5_9BACL